MMKKMRMRKEKRDQKLQQIRQTVKNKMRWINLPTVEASPLRVDIYPWLGLYIERHPHVYYGNACPGHVSK